MVHSRSLLLAWLLLGAAWVDEAIAGPVQVLKNMRSPRSFFRQSCLAVHRFILATSGSSYSSDPKRDINASSPHLQSSSDYFLFTYTRTFYSSSLILNCLFFCHEFVVFVRTYDFSRRHSRGFVRPRLHFNNIPEGVPIEQETPTKCLLRSLRTVHITQVTLGSVHRLCIMELVEMAAIPVSN
jgi:hypothetical protein